MMGDVDAEINCPSAETRSDQISSVKDGAGQNIALYPSHAARDSTPKSVRQLYTDCTPLHIMCQSQT